MRKKRSKRPKKRKNLSRGTKKSALGKNLNFFKKPKALLTLRVNKCRVNIL